MIFLKKGKERKRTRQPMGDLLRPKFGRRKCLDEKPRRSKTLNSVFNAVAVWLQSNELRSVLRQLRRARKNNDEREVQFLRFCAMKIISGIVDEVEDGGGDNSKNSTIS